MTLKFNEKEFTNAEDVLCGFTTTEEGTTKTHFNLIASPELQFNTAMQLIQSITVNLFTVFIKEHPEAKESVFDAYNMMAASILDWIIPDAERPLNLEEEAILLTEQKLIEEKYDALTEEQKEMAKERLVTIKNRLLEASKPQTTDEPSNI